MSKISFKAMAVGILVYFLCFALLIFGVYALQINGVITSSDNLANRVQHEGGIFQAQTQSGFFVIFNSIAKLLVDAISSTFFPSLVGGYVCARISNRDEVFNGIVFGVVQSIVFVIYLQYIFGFSEFFFSRLSLATLVYSLFILIASSSGAYYRFCEKSADLLKWEFDMRLLIGFVASFVYSLILSAWATQAPLYAVFLVFLTSIWGIFSNSILKNTQLRKL